MRSFWSKVLPAFLVACLIFVSLPCSVFASVRYEYNTATVDDEGSVYADVWNMQTFTPSVTHEINSVKLKLYRIGNPGTFTVSLRATSVGNPTGADLVYCDYAGNSLSTNTSGVDTLIEFNEGLTVNATTRYAIVLRAIAGNYPDNRVGFKSNSTDTYAGGDRKYSSNSGSSWTATGKDIYFEEWSGLALSTKLVVGTGTISNMISGNVTLSGYILGLAEANASTVGFRYGINSANLTDNVTEAGSWGIGSFNLVVSGLGSGTTYYYSALANDGVTWEYGPLQSFIYADTSNAISVTTSGYTPLVSGGQAVYSLSGIATSNVTILNRGFQIGLADGIWEQTLRLEQLAVGSVTEGGYWLDNSGQQIPFSGNSTSGAFSISTSLLSANTTYYYQAYASLYVSGSSGTWVTFYGNTLSLITTAGAALGDPVLTTGSAWVSPATGLLSMGGTLVSSPTSVIERGFRYSLSADMVGFSSTSAIANAFPTGYYMRTTTLTGAFTTQGVTIYVQAFARNSSGNTGYGNIISYVVPAFFIGPGGLFIRNNAVTINGNTAMLSATVSNPGAIVINRYGFVWGETSACDDFSWNDLAPEAISTITHVITDLDASTVYFFKAGVMIANGNWYWSSPTAFTTGSTLPLPLGGKPMVETLAASGTGANYFNANGNLLGLGDTIGSYVSARGFVYSLVNSGSLSTWAYTGASGNFSTGLFSRMISVTETNRTVYYAASAANQYGTSYGKIFYVNLGSLGQEGPGSGGSGVSGGGTIGGFAQFLKNMMADLGMDNASGHWAFMFLLMLIVAIGFGVGILLTREHFLRTLLAVLLAGFELTIFGGFVFSNLLGIWTVIILILTCAGLIVVFLGNILNRGRA